MNRDHLDNALAGFYEARRPAPDRALRLVDLAMAETAAPRPFARIAGPLTWGIAAALLLASTAVVAYRVGKASAPAARPVYIQPAQTVAAPRKNDSVQPKLILVRAHADWCPRCPTIAPIFADLTRKYANEPILFITLDITSPETRQQAWMMADSLGVLNLIGQPGDNGRRRVEPGVIQLIDRDVSAVLAEIRTTDDQPQFEQRLASVLPENAPPQRP